MLVLGTANRKKGIELAELLRPAGLELRTLADFPGDFDVAEEGETFAANARLKAAGYARLLGQWALADDSGLEVDALGGQPGVFSARYAAVQERIVVQASRLHRAAETAAPQGAPQEAGDESNNRLLLARLGDMPLVRRTARFVCHVAVADPSGEIRAESEAACRGRIVFQPRGHDGFGYDPLFEIVEYHRTFAELGLRVKAVLSHRARAVGRLIPQLIGLADNPTDRGL